jgi:hypothetical protein
MDAQRRVEAAESRRSACTPAGEFDLTAWVRRSTAAQGLPEKLTDADIILAVGFPRYLGGVGYLAPAGEAWMPEDCLR